MDANSPPVEKEYLRLSSSKALSPRRIEDEYELDQKTIREAFNAGELKASEIKRRLFVQRSELERWIQNKEAKRVKSLAKIT